MADTDKINKAFVKYAESNIQALADFNNTVANMTVEIEKLVKELEDKVALLRLETIQAGIDFNSRVHYFLSRFIEDCSAEVNCGDG